MAAQMLLGRADAYEGFIVSADDLPTVPEEFNSLLEQSLQVCGCTGLAPHALCYLCYAAVVFFGLTGLGIIWQKRHLDHSASSKVSAHTYCCQAWV